MMTVSVGVTSCTPQAKDLEKVEKAQQEDNFDKQGEDSENDTAIHTEQRTADLNLSSRVVENVENASSKGICASDVYSGPSKGDAVLSNQVDTPEVNNVCVNPGKTMKQGRVVSRGRRKSDNKEYNQKSQGGRRNRGRKISKGTRDYENSSSNGGNSGADGNGEDNGSDDDDEDDDADEDDDDDDEDDDDEAEDDDDDEDEEESKNEDDDDDISLNGNGQETKIKQEPSDDQEMFPAGLQGFMTGLDGNIPLANLLEKLPNSVCPGDENSSLPAAPGVPVTLHGIVCHEIGGVLVVNIKWRNKFYCGSLMDCSRHAWASPRFPAMDGGENEMKMGGKGVKGKRRQKNGSVSSSAGNVNKEVTPLKHKLRGRKRGVSGCPPPKSQGFKGMGKRRSKNIDDDDDGARPGKRSCTMKTTVSPQPSPTLIECPEPGCDKKYKHINGLRYHQAHAHLEESNQSDERSASTSPSPVEEFKEPDTKPGFKGRTSRVSARARSVSPSLAAALAAINERKNDASSKGSGGKKKEITEPCLDLTNAKEAKESSLTIPTNEEDSAMEDTSISFVESSDKCQQACEHEIRKENDNQKNVDQTKHIDSKSGFKPVLDEQQIAVKNLEKEQVKDSTNLTTCTTITAEVLARKMPDTGTAGIKSEPSQGSQEVWETAVIDCGYSGPNGSGKSHGMESETISISQVEDMEKALGENSFSDKQSNNQLSIPGMQPVDLRQAVDTGVGLINQLGIEVEDISENEEDIDPGQDSEYTNKDMTSLPCSSIIDHKNSSGIGIPRGLPFASELTQVQKSEVNLDKNFVSSDILRAKPGSSFYFDVKKQNTSTDGKINKEKNAKSLSKCDSENSDLWTNSSENVSAQSSVLRNFETKQTPLEDNAGKTTNASISMEALVSKSISRSAVEPPLTNSDAPSMRYKFFECRNYGDGNYDKCIRTSDVDQKGNVDSKATLAPIRFPELVRNGASSNALQSQSDSLPGSGSARTGLNVKLSFVEESNSDGKIINKKLPLATRNSRTRSPIPEALNRKAGVSMEPHHSTKSPSSISSLPGTSALQSSSSKTGVDSSIQSPSTLSIAGSRVHSSMVDRKTPSSPFQPVIVKHEFQPTETTKGIRQEVNTPGFTPADLKVTLLSSLSLTSGEQSKQNSEGKGSNGFNESRGNRKSPLPGQGIEDHEKSYKTAARALARPHPALISKHPSPPVGVAHPYPRASDGVMKASEHKTSATVTSVTYSSTSPRPTVVDVSAELPQLENKAKQLQTLPVPIPVGEVSPVSLKRSPGPAIHSGLPSVLPIIGPGIKTQGSVSSHSTIRPGIKAPGMNEPIRSERKNDTLLREVSAYATSKSPVPHSLAMSKPSPEGNSPQQSAAGTALHQKSRASDDSSRDDSEVVIVKDEPLTYSSSKDKAVAEKERERRDIRDTTADVSYRTHEPISAEQLRNLQLQQQLTLHQYYQASGMSMEMLKSLSQLAYMQGMPVDPKATFAAQAQLWQNIQPEQQLQLMQLHRQMLEQEKKGMRSTSLSHQEARNLEKKETPKPSDRLQEEIRMSESGIKNSPQRRAHQDDGDFRRFPSQSESLQYTSSRGSPPKVVQHKHSSEEPPEKKSRADDSYEREKEMERLRYKREEELLQKQKHVMHLAMYKQLENERQIKQLGGTFTRKRQATPEKSERHGSTREEDRVENVAGGARDLIYHQNQESGASTAKATHHSLETESSQASPRGHVGKSQSLLAPRSPRSSRSPVPTSRYKENASAADEKKDGSNSLPANFMPANQFQAYLSQLNFDQSTGQLPYQYSLPSGLVMSMPITSQGESSLVTSMASAGREREARSPYRGAERDRTSTPTSHSNLQSRTSTSESHERLQRLKDSTEKETRHSPGIYQEERARNRSTTSEQNVSPKSSSRASDFKGEDNSLHVHPSIISSNLAISRMAGHMDVRNEEEIIRRQRYAAEYTDPSQALRMGYCVAPGLIGQLDPAFAASMMQSSQHQHMGRGIEHYITKRQ